MKIRFTANRVTQTATYQAGREYDLPDDEAQHWLADGVADEVTKEVKDAPNKSLAAPTRRKRKKVTTK